MTSLYIISCGISPVVFIKINAEIPMIRSNVYSYILIKEKLNLLSADTCLSISWQVAVK
jgi:hypothetical protein